MHLPDGYLSDPVCLATATASTAALAWSVLQMRFEEQRGPAGRMAAVGAGVFAVHLLNVPIDHGMSGHLLGAAAAAALLGPWAATLTISVVLALECLLFADGGLASLGANVLNMAVLAPWISAAVLLWAAPDSRNQRLVAVGLAGFLAVMAAAAACAVELVVSGTGSLADVFPAMLSAHAVVGIGEGCLTAVMCALIRATTEPTRLGRAVALALGFGVLAAPCVSGLPDGLERVAQMLNFAPALPASTWAAVAPDYVVPGIEWQPAAAALAAMLGIGSVWLATYGASRLATIKVRRHFS